MEGGTIIKLGLIAGAGWLLWDWFAGQAQASATPASPSPATPGASTPPASNGQLTSTFTALVNAANTANPQSSNPTMWVNGSLVLNGDQWNYYLAQVVPNLTPPDAVAMFGARPQTPFTAATYWAQVGPWLTTNKGMSGVDEILWRWAQAVRRA